jgi:hypothetical protein
MDPNYGQTPPPPPPGPATPPDWSQSGQYGQPGPYGQYGQPAGWPAPAPARRSRLPMWIAIIVAAVVVLGILIVVVVQNVTPPDAGKVVFSTDKPTAGFNCVVHNQVTTVTVGQTVYAYYIYKHKLGSEEVTLSVTKDGTTLGSTTIPASDTQGTSCYGDITNLGSFPAGSYTFKLTTGSETLAEGTLTVTP